MRRAQSALEFLTTYGWAFLVILIMIGALAYFGVLNPSKAMPSKCLVEAGFDCKDFIIYEDSFNINVINKKGEGIKGVDIINITSNSFITPPNIAACTIDGNVNPVTVATEKEMVISCAQAGMFGGLAGDKVKIEFKINYTMARGTYAQRFEGDVLGTVQ